VFTRVLVDANVLVSRTLRDWLLMIQIEAPGMYATCYTEDLLAEAVYSIRRRNPAMPGEAVTAIADTIRRVMSERIESFSIQELAALRDMDDLHVHSAAISGEVNMVLTDDKGFLGLPEAVTDALPYEIISADAFFVLVDDSSPEAVAAVTVSQWDYWRKKDPATDLPQRLRDAGCPEFAQRVWRHQRGGV
jgi:predicted nucleic acid-binding protein